MGRPCVASGDVRVCASARRTFCAAAAPQPEDRLGRTHGSAAQLAVPRDRAVDTIRVGAGAAGPQTAVRPGSTWSRTGPTRPRATTAVKRTKAVEYSEGYYKRLAIHRTASYADLPARDGGHR